MRFLVVAPASAGLVFPLVAIGRELRAIGHEVVFATGAAIDPHLHAAGFTRVPTTPVEEQAVTVKLWAYAPAVAIQVDYVLRAIAALEVDALLAHTLALNALAAAELAKIPVFVVGLGIWIWPTPEDPGDAPRTSRRRRRLAETLRLNDLVRAEVGLSTSSEQRTLLGTRFLVQSDPAFAWSETLPHETIAVGPCLWEPPCDDPELIEVLARARRDKRPVIYAQPARTFGDPGFWSSFVEAVAAERVQVIASLGRLDDIAHVALPDNIFARAHAPQGVVLSHADLVVTTGHSTSFLGALLAGVPLLAIPHGSGTEDIAELIVERRFGRTLDAATIGAAILRATVRDLLTDHELLARVRAHAARLPRDGARRAAHAILATISP